MSENEIYKAALNKFGATKQIFKTFEEIADVRIMLEQMLILFDCRGLSDRYRREKVARLEKAVER